MDDETDADAVRELVRARHEAEERTRREQEHPDLAAVSARLADLDRSFDELIESFPEAERDQAARLVYMDADGKAATRYGRLRPL